MWGGGGVLIVLTCIVLNVGRSVLPEFPCLLKGFNTFKIVGEKNEKSIRQRPETRNLKEEAKDELTPGAGL